MAKRFTETDKWRDKWFRALRPEHKLAWLYLLDNCDSAGVIDTDCELANFQIGIAIDWDQFLTHCDDRVEVLSNGKLWVVKFVEYQYGELSEDCRAHNPVFASLKRYSLLNRVLEGYSKGIQRDKDKDKDKDKAKDLVIKKEEWIVPEHLDAPEVRSLLTDFARMRERIKKPIKDFANSSKVLRHFDDVEHLVYALETCIANEYQGLKADYRKPSPAFAKTGARTIQKTFAQMAVDNTKDAGEEWLAHG